MMKMKRYALLLAGLTLLSLAGCGTAQTPSTAEDNPPFADTPADVPSATEISDDITAEESALPAAEPERPAITEPVPSQTAAETAAETPPIENTAAPPAAQSEPPRRTAPAALAGRNAEARRTKPRASTAGGSRKHLLPKSLPRQSRSLL